MDTAIDLGRRLDRRSKSGAIRNKTIGARVSETEEGELVHAAHSLGLNVSEWSREVLLREARRSKDDALFTETIATRMLLVNLLRPLLLREPVSTETISEIMAGVRQQKHETAREVMKQYEPTQKGEQA